MKPGFIIIIENDYFPYAFWLHIQHALDKLIFFLFWTHG